MPPNYLPSNTSGSNTILSSLSQATGLNNSGNTSVNNNNTVQYSANTHSILLDRNTSQANPNSQQGTSYSYSSGGGNQQMSMPNSMTHHNMMPATTNLQNTSNAHYLNLQQPGKQKVNSVTGINLPQHQTLNNFAFINSNASANLNNPYMIPATNNTNNPLHIQNANEVSQQQQQQQQLQQQANNNGYMFNTLASNNNLAHNNMTTYQQSNVNRTTNSTPYIYTMPNNGRNE